MDLHQPPVLTGAPSSASPTKTKTDIQISRSYFICRVKKSQLGTTAPAPASQMTSQQKLDHETVLQFITASLTHLDIHQPQKRRQKTLPALFGHATCHPKTKTELPCPIWTCLPKTKTTRQARERKPQNASDDH